MDRYTITPEEQTILDDLRTEWGVQMTDVVVPGSNLVVDDHIEVDHAWKIAIIGPGQDGSIDCLMLEWGDMVLRNFDLFEYISDRAGPDAQTMPVTDPEPELQARQSARSATEGGQNPKHAAKAERKEERAHRRDLKEVLREAIQRLPHKEQKHAREVLRTKGVLGKDD